MGFEGDEGRVLMWGGQGWGREGRGVGEGVLR